MSNPRQIGEGYYRKAMEHKESGDYIGALNEIRLAISNYPHDPAYVREREVIEGLLDPARLSDEARGRFCLGMDFHLSHFNMFTTYFVSDTFFIANIECHHGRIVTRSYY